MDRTALPYLSVADRPAVPVARTADEVRQIADNASDLTALDDAISCCRACPRLVEWREEVAATKRAAFRDQEYWGRPSPGFGPADATIGIAGLAPAAHGANRTGRVFTGDRSGDWLYAALFRAGLANQPTAVAADDGLHLIDTRVFASVRCAPPANKPTPVERDTCQPWLERELTLLPRLSAIVVLGGFGWKALWPALVATGAEVPGYSAPGTRPVFGHGAEVVVRAHGRDLAVLGCYHVSQQNTFTGRLTEEMLDTVFARARTFADLT